MKIKTLAIAAATLAVGAISSQADSGVYSQNVVGYVNVVFPAGAYVLASNPLDDGTNTCNSVGANLPNKSSIEVWNGSGYTGSSKASGVWTPNLSLPPGIGFFVIAKTAVTNTFVGTVTTGASVTNSLAAGAYIMAASALPYSGDLNDTNLNLGPSLPNKSNIQVWTGTNFIGSSKASGVWTPNLTLSVGEGFFVIPKTATNWIQTLPSN